MSLLKKIFKKRQAIPRGFNSKRANILLTLYLMGFTVVVSRAVVIQLFPPAKKNLENIASRQYEKDIKLAPYRGAILDRRSIPFAISIKTPSLFVNPRVFSPTKKERRKIAKILGIKESKIKKIAARKNYFSWLKRHTSTEQAEEVAELNLKGVSQVEEPTRYYPGSEIGSNLIGLVGVDGKGLLGLEQKLDKNLRAKVSKTLTARDSRGKVIILDSDNAKPEVPGNSVILTVDRAVQEIADNALGKWVKESKAKGGYAIVSDPHTGRILAIANYPKFDPNNRKKLKMKDTKNLATSMVFEPGSVMKPFVIAKAMEDRLINENTLFNCEKSGRYKIGRRAYIHDDHPKEFLTTEGVIVHSSNICTFKIAAMGGRQTLFDYFNDFGFNDRGKILGLPGEEVGRISNPKNWRPIRFANIAFGQGMLVTGLEIIRAYSVIANGGNLIDPYIVDRVIDPNEKILASFSPNMRGQVLSPETSLKMRKMLQKVVSLKGTARRAATEDYTTAGKTGTAEKADEKTKAYSKTARIASFAGFAPVKDPHIVVYVVIDEPNREKNYGGLWAAPAFSEIVDGTLKYLNVAPDKFKKTAASANQKKTL